MIVKVTRSQHVRICIQLLDRYRSALRATDIHSVTRGLLPGLLCLLLASGCSDAPGGGGIGGTGKTDLLYGEGIVIGAIDSQGGINGRIYDTAGASITLDGNSGDSTALKTGMSVSARVNHDALKAQSVNYQPLVTGPVQSIDNTSNTITVLDNTIMLSMDTELDNLTTEILSPGMIVEVSGTRSTDDTIVASYLAYQPQSSEFFTVGTVDVVDTDSSSTVLSSVAIDLQDFADNSGITQTELSQILVPGATIRAEIDPASLLDAKKPISARGLRAANSISFESGESLQVSGPVTRVTPDSITVNGLRLTVDEETLGFTLPGDELESFQVRLNENVTVTGITLTDSSPGGANASTAPVSYGSTYAITIILLDRF